MVNTVKFCEVLFSRSFVKIKPSPNGEITLSFTDKVYQALVTSF